MPLPPALQARLQKRGILKEPAHNKNNDVEEVFAEDYDEPMKEGSVVPSVDIPVEEPAQEERGPLVNEVSACPNRSNPYHVCSSYCEDRWGMKQFTPDDNMIRKRDRMLQRYPLPEGWEEIADPNTDRYYYWNTITDEVSWLSPLHPRAEITLSAPNPQDSVEDRVQFDTHQTELHSDEEFMDVNESEESELSSSSSSSSESEEEEYDKRRRGRQGRNDRRDNRRGRGKREELDPMDPAAYSEVPRGSWSTGLASRGEAKTGADTTASGPLFQQRPYPSPGEILRRNRESQGN